MDWNVINIQKLFGTHTPDPIISPSPPHELTSADPVKIPHTEQTRIRNRLSHQMEGVTQHRSDKVTLRIFDISLFPRTPERKPPISLFLCRLRDCFYAGREMKHCQLWLRMLPLKYFHFQRIDRPVLVILFLEKILNMPCPSPPTPLQLIDSHIQHNTIEDNFVYWNSIKLMKCNRREAIQ